VGSPIDMDVESMGSNCEACFGRGSVKVGSGGGAVMLKQCQTELIRGYIYQSICIVAVLYDDIIPPL
jgi:hypothetical protein